MSEDIYVDIRVQLFLALLLLTNFVWNVAMLPTPKECFIVEPFYNIMFTINVVFNMMAFGHRFWRGCHNLADLLVTAVGVTSMTPAADRIPNFDIIHTLVLCRIFFIMKRIESLNKVLVSLLHSVAAAVNILLIIIVLFVIQVKCAQALWSEAYPDHFGDFTESLSSIFMVWTLSASSVLAILENRPLAITFFAFFCILEFVFLHILGAVVLDQMAKAHEKVGQQEAAGEKYESLHDSEQITVAQ